MMSVQSIEDSAPANAFPSTIKANINLFKTELIKYRNNFTQQLGEILPEVIYLKIVSKCQTICLTFVKVFLDFVKAKIAKHFSSQVRGKNIKEDRLFSILNDLADSPFELGKSQSFLGKLEREIGTIALYMDKRGDPGKGIVVEEDSSAKGNECRTKFGFQIEFVLPVLPDDDRVKAYLENKTLNDDMVPWYDNDAQVSTAGYRYRSFVDFFDINKDINNVACFIVGLKKVQENQNPQISIYGPGKKITDNLNVPKKLEPQDIQINYNTITFDISYKTDFEGGNVMNNIEVLYQGFPDFPKNSKTVQVAENGITTIGLTQLKPGVTYEVKQRLVSRLDDKVWAYGPWSDPLIVTTSFSSPPSSLSVRNKGNKK